MEDKYKEYHNEDPYYIPPRDPRGVNVKDRIAQCNSIKSTLPDCCDDSVEESDLQRLEASLGSPDSILVEKVVESSSQALVPELKKYIEEAISEESSDDDGEI